MGIFFFFLFSLFLHSLDHLVFCFPFSLLPFPFFFFFRFLADQRNFGEGGVGFGGAVQPLPPQHRRVLCALCLSANPFPIAFMKRRSDGCDCDDGDCDDGDEFQFWYDSGNGSGVVVGFKVGRRVMVIVGGIVALLLVAVKEGVVMMMMMMTWVGVVVMVAFADDDVIDVVVIDDVPIGVCSNRVQDGVGDAASGGVGGGVGGADSCGDGCGGVGAGCGVEGVGGVDEVGGGVVGRGSVCGSDVAKMKCVCCGFAKRWGEGEGRVFSEKEEKRKWRGGGGLKGRQRGVQWKGVPISVVCDDDVL